MVEMESSKPDLALALSGGGHRATLFAAGALLALVDRGLNKRVCQIASVSGGSITNAFVAQRCDFDKLEPGDFDEIAEELVRRVVTCGVVETWVLILVVVLPGLLAGAALAVSDADWPWWTLLPLFLIALSALSVGRVIENLLDRRYFRVAVGTPTGSPRARMHSLAPRRVEHVFCATDLVQGQPLYMSSHAGGRVWRRTTALSIAGQLDVRAQQWEAKELTIAEVVRASASFPGIPPKRLSFGRWSRLKRIEEPTLTFGGRIRETGEPPALRARRVAFLADGGLWNNLGTHVVREDHFLRGKSHEVPHILCINASAPLPASSPIPNHIPVIATVWALIQSVRILNVNTIQPRLQRMREAQHRRISHAIRPDAIDPLDLVVDLTPVSLNLTLKALLTRHREDIRRSDPAVRKWEGDILDEVKKWGLQCDSVPTREDAWTLAETLAKKLYHQPLGESATAGMADYDSFDDLRDNLDKTAGGSEPDTTPTTLGRLRPDAALRLLVRGYVNTYIESVFLKQFSHGESARLRSAQERLRRMIPGLSCEANDLS